MSRLFIRKTLPATLTQQVLRQAATPLTLQEIHQAVIRHLPKTAFSTIYRVVRKLEKNGEVLQVTWKERGSRYEWANRAHHHHIVCESCGTVDDIDDATLAYNQGVVEAKTGFHIKHHTIELTGVCSPCQEKELA